MDSIIPEILFIETTNVCNANCIFCAYQYDERPKNNIDFSLFKKVASRYKEAGGKKVSLSPFAGEIFSDKSILEKINYLKGLKFELVYTYSNALLFHKFKIEDILNSGLTAICISLAPLLEDSYLNIYRNKHYKQLLINLHNFLSAFNKLEKKTIKKISIEFRSDISLSEIQRLDDYKVYIEPFLNENVTVSSMQTFDSWMGMIKQSDLLEGMSIKNADFDKLKPCVRLNMLQVLANGDTRVCGCRYNNNPNSTEDVFKVGSANTEDIIYMYNKEKVFTLKESFNNKTIPLECKLCSWYEGA